MAVRFKRYPRAAMDNNWEGTTELNMVIRADGSIGSVTIRSSAGHDVLDRQAIDMFRKAKALVPVPPALQGKEFSIVLKAIYTLEDPDA
jgi:periplasmic protein TonB